MFKRMTDAGDQVATNRIDTWATRSERVLQFVVLMMGARLPVPLATLDAGEWGCSRTIRRMIQEVNATWERFHGHPFVEVVPGTDGDRVVRRVSRQGASRGDEVLALQVALNLTPELRGTWIHKYLTDLYRSLCNGLDAPGCQKLGRLQTRITRSGDGVSAAQSGLKARVIDRIMRAIADECSVTVIWTESGTRRIAHCRIMAVQVRPGGMMVDFLPVEPPLARRFLLPVDSVVDIVGAGS